MPPTGLFLLVVVGLLLRLVESRARVRRLGTALAIAGGALVVLLSVPWVAAGLLGSLQKDPPIPVAETRLDAGAIVVLAADVDCDALELGGDQPGPLSLQRCRYGALLARRTGLPLVITGGVLRPHSRPVSHILRDFVQDELSVPVAWTEDEAKTTRQNARRTAALLSERGIGRIALVTHAWHMPRAEREFEVAGVAVLPAPTGFHVPPHAWLHGLVPRGSALRDSCWAIHEYAGRLWYRLTR